MKQSLQLRLGQQITMTPQLQQAIRLLQLSTLDLQMEIQQALESNMMLEEGEEALEVEISDEQKNKEAAGEGEATTDTTKEVQLEKNENLPEELDTDSSWEDTYGQDYSDFGHSDYPTGDSEYRDIAVHSSPAPTLYDHLIWQLDLTPFSDTDRAIALTIIDGIDADGYLKSSLEDILISVNSGEKEEDEELVLLEEVETVLRRLQHFDPVGVGARDLGECLLLQLTELDKTTPWLKEAQLLVKEHLSLLAVHDYTQLLKRMKMNRQDLQEVVELIQSLHPRPGAIIESHQAAYVIPDVFVKKIKGRWQVDLNPEVTPNLRVNQQYASLISRTSKREDVSSLKNHLQEARWFIKSVQSRHETLLKVARCIVKRQSAFLDYGEEAMKPLVLHDIASELEMHESTISRVTTQKFIHTHRGIFELKYFFSSHVSTSSGGECSSTAIRALIRKLIAAENRGKPLSDSKIANLLSDRGINVARRTVAKYREAMVIPPSNERKRLG